MTPPAPPRGLRSLPLGRRVRLELLVGLQRWIDRRAGGARGVRDRLPATLRRTVRRWVAPVRIPRGTPRAFVPLDSPTPQRPVRSRPGDDPAGSAPPDPAASIVIVTHGQLAHTRLCLRAVRAFTDPRLYEVLVVDNGSADATPRAMEEMAQRWSHLRFLPQGRNRGFAGGVNAGVREARGDIVVVLNNDTVPTAGWLATLLGHLERLPRSALVGPTTNDSGDVATVPASYGSLADLEGFASLRARRCAGSVRSVGKLSLFCAAVRRADFEHCGGLDEGYGLGMFEDDDLCVALRARGRDVTLARDVFVHHDAGASFRHLAPRTYLTQFELNRARFERKWGVRWKPTAP